MSARKRTSLEAVFGAEQAIPIRAKGQGAPKAVPADAGTQAQSVSDEQGRGREAVAKRPNVKQHTAYLPLSVHEQLRKLAFEENRKIHDYLIEGLNRVFADRGLPNIKELN